MVQPGIRGQSIHVELLCGGRPAFEVACEIRNVVSQQGSSCHIIHLDRPDERERYGTEDRFIALEWDDFIRAQLQRDSKLGEALGRKRLDRVLERWPAHRIPFNDALAVRLAAHVKTPVIEAELIRDVEAALMQGFLPFVAVCLVPEGPTGMGVAWSLMDHIPQWERKWMSDLRARGVPVPQNAFNFFLLEFVPAKPDDDGDLQNVLQGYMSRRRLYQRQWPYYWFRFDGSKVHQTNNRAASRIGAIAMGLMLTSRFVPVTATST